MADSQEAEQAMLSPEENVEVIKSASATSSPTPAVSKVDQEGEVKEEGQEAIVEKSEADESTPDKAPEPSTESAATDEPNVEGSVAQPEEGAEQTEGAVEPSSEEQKPTGDAPAEGAPDIVVEAAAEGEKVEGEHVEGEQVEGEQGEGEKAEGEQVEGEKAEGEQVEGEKVEGEKVEGEKGEGDTEGAKKEGEGAEEDKGEGAVAVTTEGEETASAETADKDAAAEEGKKSPLPQSDTFDEGERPESPGRVGEKLSREPTPEKIDLGEALPETLKPESPIDEHGGPLHPTVYEETEEGLEEEDKEAEEEEEEHEEEFDREGLIAKYHSFLTDREQLQAQNSQLQHKLADYFRKKKADERQDYDKNLTDQEQRYLKYMAQLEDLRRQDMQQREHYQIQIEDHKDKCEDKRARVDEERQKFMEFKKQIALSAINTRSGKPIPPKDTEQYLSNENKKELEVVNVRLENIKLKNKLKKKEQQLKSKEELAEGLHLIDFEQLKIENQTYNEKIEERNEELLKLRKKITSTVQVLTHLKEKLQFVQAENHVQRGNLREVESLAAQKRDILSRTKQARDSLRIDNQRLRQNCGLLGNEPLLRDFEERVDESEELRDKLERMKMVHAEMTLTCNQVRKKIEQARSGRT